MNKKYMGIGLVTSAIVTARRLIMHGDDFGLEWDEAETWLGAAIGFMLNVLLWPVALVIEIIDLIKECVD